MVIQKKYFLDSSICTGNVRFLVENIVKTLCSNLIPCHLDYSCSSWYFGLSTTLKKKLQISQNKTVIA